MMCVAFEKSDRIMLTCTPVSVNATEGKRLTIRHRLLKEEHCG
jgi:hypothetical protein